MILAMSGHSKWSTIKRKKETADSKRGALFTKIAHQIMIAAREGGEELETNFKLKLAIEKARGVNMPNENIKRAIVKGMGEVGGKNMEEVFYEGFGPGRAALIIKCVTDNRNRTVAEIRKELNDAGGRLVDKNGVMWMFESKGVIRLWVDDEVNKEDLELFLIDLGVEEVKIEKNYGEVVCGNSRLVVGELERWKGVKINSAEIEMKPKNIQELSTADFEKYQRLYKNLSEMAEVGMVFGNGRKI